MNPSPEPAPSANVLRRPMFLWSTPFTFLYFGLPIISKAFGASAAQIGGLFSVLIVTTLLLRPLVGWSIDRFGRKSFLVTAMLIYAAAMALFALASSMTWLYAARLVQGIGSAFLWTAANTLVADLTPPAERGRALGALAQITTQGGLVGVLAAYVLMTNLPDNLGWKVSFLGFTALTLAAAFLAWKSVPETPPSRRAPRSGGKVALSGPFLKLLVVVFITGVPEAMLAPIYLVYLQDRFQVDIGTLAWAFFPAGIAAALLSTRLGALSDRFGRAPMMALGMAGAGVIMLLMPGLTSLVMLAVLYTLLSVLQGISEPAETAIVADLTGGDRLGTSYGIYDFVENLGFAAGPLLGGLMYDQISRSAPFYLNGAILLISTVWVMVFLRKTHPQTPAPDPGAGAAQITQMKNKEDHE